MAEELHGEEGYVPEQEREAAEDAAESGEALTNEEAEEAERALAEADEEPDVLPPTDDAPADEDPDSGYAGEPAG